MNMKALITFENWFYCYGSGWGSLGLTGQMDISTVLAFLLFSFGIFGSIEPISDLVHVLNVINNALD